MIAVFTRGHEVLFVRCDTVETIDAVKARFASDAAHIATVIGGAMAVLGPNGFARPITRAEEVLR